MMNSRRQYTYSTRQNPLGNFGALLTTILILVGIYYLIKGAYFVLGIIAPILLIATLIIDHKVITNYLKFLLTSLKNNPVLGLVYILLTIVGSPFVAGFLFAKAWMKRSLNKYMGEQNSENQYTEFEEVIEEEDFLILPNIDEAKKVERKNNDYEDLFE